MGINIIITGATGMVGEGVLLSCLENPQVASILSISRKSAGMSHPKLKELVVSDFFKLEEYKEQLKGYSACFYCAGVSSLGLDEKTYSYITYDTTLYVANVLISANPFMTFNFVSGGHTDSSEQGKVMWSRVKGKTENMLQRMSFKKVYCFRPALMKPMKSQRNLKGYNRYVNFFYPFMSLFFTGCRIDDIGKAMVNAVLTGYPTSIVEAPDIKKLGKSAA